MRYDRPPSSSRLRIEPSSGERRQLTVLFCDLVNSTGLSHRIDPEDLHDVLHVYYEACTQAAERYEGHVAQYLGDGLMIYFGYPQAQEDAARRAVCAGLGIVASLDALNADLEAHLGIRLAVRVGIHTGLVVIREGVDGEPAAQLAVGATPNVASRLQGLAEANTVVVSAATHELIQGYFACRDLGAHTLPGIASPMQVYRVMQESGAQTRLDITPTWGPTPFVGREKELESLRQQWERARSGMGQVVWLSGEAGIGKSRLAQAVKAEIAQGECVALECRCSPYYQNTALYPLIDWLQHRLDWQHASAEDKVQKLQALLAPYDVAPPEAFRLMAKLLSLPLREDRYPPLTLTPREQRQQTFETLLTLCLAPPAAPPVLLIVEDLHWADPSTLEFLGLLIGRIERNERGRQASIMAIFTSRPTFQPLWATDEHPHFHAMALQRLPQSHAEAMLPSMTRGKALPPEVVEQLMIRADGIPLFVEELTKAFLASDLLEEGEDRYELRQGLSSLAIPFTLQDSLTARLDKLVSGKPVAQLGATIGRWFAYDLLQAVAPWGEETLRAGLRQLVEAELCYQHGEGPQARYSFKHALIQEAAYESLLKRQRRHYHQQIAQALEQQFPEAAAAHPEFIAHHYTQAEMPEQAVVHWQRAGHNAMERVAPHEALTHLHQGLTVLSTLPETPERDREEVGLQLALGPALMMVQSFTAPEVEQAFARARELSLKLDDSASLFQALRGLGRVYHIRKKLRTAQELIEACLHLVQPDQDPAQLVEAHKLMGIVLALQGHFAEARQHFEEGLAHYESCDHHHLIELYGEDPGVVCLTRMAYVLWQLGYADLARARIQSARALAADHQHAPSLAYVLNHAARIFQCCGAWEDARDLTLEAISIAEVRGLASWYTAPLAVWRGWALVGQDREAEGRAELREGLTEWEARGMQGVSPYFLAFWAETHIYMGDTAAAQRVLSEAFRVVEETEEQAELPRLQCLQGELLFGGDGLYEPAVERCFQEALGTAHQQRAKAFELRAAMGLSRLWREQGKGADAHHVLAGVYAGFTEGVETVDLQAAQALLAALQGG